MLVGRVCYSFHMKATSTLMINGALSCFLVLLGCTPQKSWNKTPRKGQSQFSARAQDEILFGGKVFDLINKDRGLTYGSVFSTAKLEAVVPSEKLPYQGFWYPEKTNGTALVLTDGKSPVQKYDEAFNGGQSLAQDWEKKNHGSLQEGEIPNWYGHCNGFSAASIRHAEPEKDVAMGQTTFRRQDIKALLAEIYMGAKYLYLGGNRCSKAEALGARRSLRNDPEYMGECEDLNPAQMHVSLLNWLGSSGYPLIMDMSRNSEVWNYPVFAYRFKATELSKSKAIEALGETGEAYVFNSSAVAFQSIEMIVWYSDAFSDSEHVGQAQTPTALTMTYVLEMDSLGRILGGEWTGSSQQDHPDFLWLAFEPMAGTGHRSFNNPHVKPEQVIDLWKKSLAEETLKKQLIFDEPKALSDWGKFRLYEVALDGFRSPVTQGKGQHLLNLSFVDGPALFKNPGRWVVYDQYENELASGKIEIATKSLDLKIPLGIGRENLRLLLQTDQPKMIDTQGLSVVVTP